MWVLGSTCSFIDRGVSSSEVDIALVAFLKGGNLMDNGDPSDAVRFTQKTAGLSNGFALLFPGPSSSVKKWKVLEKS